MATKSVRFAAARAAATGSTSSAALRKTASAATSPAAVRASAAGQRVSASGSAAARAAVKATQKVGERVTPRPGPVVERPPVLTFNQFTRRVVRPRDLLALDFTFVNLRVESDGQGNRQLTRREANKPAYIVVGFPPQHLLERAFFETSPETPIVHPPPSGQPVDPDKSTGNEDPKDIDIPVASRLAGTSRLVFRVPGNVTALRYTLTDVLAACRDYELSVAPTATPPDPLLVFRPGIEVSLAAEKFGQAAVATGPKVKAGAAGRSVAARSMAAQAFTAAVSAEVQNQWYAKRSPLARPGTLQADVARVSALLEAIRILPELAPPTDTQTAIEAPTRMILSPNSYGAWVHATAPVESAQSGRVELWHTRLAIRATGGVTEEDDFRRTVRAIWSPDVKAAEPFAFTEHPEPPTPFRASLDAFDRHNIVHLSANHQLFLPGPGPKKRHKPQPIDVDRLMLTSLGVWMNVRGAWDPPPPLSVEEWRHRATLGRDHYVRVVYAGALYPFGHRASLIKVTERKFHPDKKGNAAFLRQRMFIIVREPFRLLGNTHAVNAAGESLDLKMPLKSARITTLVTPNLDLPSLEKCGVVAPSGGANAKGQSLFWPHVGGPPFRFHLQFEDEAGARIDAAMPLFFLGNEQLAPGTKLVPPALGDVLAPRYSTHPPFQAFRRTSLNGQRVQLAPTAKPGDTSFELAAIEFCLAFKSGKLIPGMGSAAASVPALKHLARSQVAPELKFPSLFLKAGFAATGANANPGQVFLELLDPNATKLNLSGQGDRVGALLAPNLAISGLSRSLGPVGGDLPTVATAGLQPDKFFGNLGDLLPKLFGCIKITDILDAVGLGDLTKLPRFMSENLTAAQALTDDVGRIQAHLAALNGKLSGLAAEATALANAGATLVTRLSALLADPLAGAKRDAFTAGFGELAAAARALRGGFGGLAVPEDAQFAKTQLDQLLAKFSVGLEQAAEVVALADRIADSLEAVNEQRIKFEWRPPIKSWPAGQPIFEVLPGGGLVIAVELAAQSGTSHEPSMDVACRLQKFDLNLIAPETFLKLHFNKIEFTASSREKPDVNVDFGGIEFVGVLSFVETLRTLIPLDGFSDPPALTVSEEGIEASFSLGLPNIAVGVFSLSNLSLGAALTVPFLGQQPLSVRFNFCERSDPFRLTVWVFGGGGFFAVTVTPAGVQVLEASFEFGACVALDFGVASGSISVMAGIYFRMEADDASLTGYFNLKGRVSVLGLITASLELSLELYYEFDSGKCVGRATLVIEVEVLFFSASVEVTCEKKLAGANGDPSFAQIMAPYADPVTGETVDPWTDYCEAFAA